MASIIYLALPLLTASNNLPILTLPRQSDCNGGEQPRFQDLFGFSTPEVYRIPGRPEKPWALTPRFHPYHYPAPVRIAIGNRGGVVAVYFLWHLLSPAEGAFPLGSRMLYVARTFLFQIELKAIERFAGQR